MCGQSSFINLRCCHLFATLWEISLTCMYMFRLDRRKPVENTCVRQSCHVPFSKFLAHPTTTATPRIEEVKETSCPLYSSWIECRSDGVTKTFLFALQRFEYQVSVEHNKNRTKQNITSKAKIWWESVLGGPKYGRMNRDLICVNWPGSKQLWSRSIYTDISGLVKYSCSQISVYHEPIHVNLKFGVFHRLKYVHENATCAKRKLMKSHFSILNTRFLK